MADAHRLDALVATAKTALDLLTSRNAKLDYISWKTDNLPLAQQNVLRLYIERPV